jgi:diguanylate cyclase (GGDEF)-like protein
LKNSTSGLQGESDVLPPEVVTLIPYPVARRLKAVAIAMGETDVTVLMAQSDNATLAELQDLLGRTVQPVVVPSERIEELLRRLAGAGADDDLWLQARHIQALNRLVDHSLNLGQPEQVEHLIERALQFAPYSVELWLLKARVSQQHADVLSALERAAQTAPDDPRVRRWLQSLYESDNRPSVEDGREQPTADTTDHDEIGAAFTTPHEPLHSRGEPSAAEPWPTPLLTVESVLQTVLDLVGTALYGQAGDRQQLLERLADRSQMLAAADSVTVFLRNNGSWDSWSTDENLRARVRTALPRSQGLAARVLHDGTALIVADTRTQRQEVGSIVHEAHIGSFALLPLRDNGRVNGLLYLNYQEPGRAALIDSSKPLGRSLELLANCAGVMNASLRAREGLMDLVAYDPLTHIYNAQQLDRLLHTEVERARRYSYALSALVIDLDDFAQINYRYGQEIGDAVLQEAAACLASIVRNCDLLGRQQEDTFVLILPQTTARAAQTVARRIHRRFEEPLIVSAETRLPVTVSIGVATFPEQATEARALLNAASIAMYRAKAQGKHRTATADTLNLGE